MKSHPLLIAALLVPLSVSSQQLTHQQKFPATVPAGNYSGITALGGDRYALVSDKSATDGFFVFQVDIDTVRWRISRVVNEGFRSSGHPNRDQEGIAYVPATHTLFISGEADQQVYEYQLDGQRTGRRLAMPDAFLSANCNYGLEALCFDRQTGLFWTTTEQPLPGDSLLRLQAFGTDLQPAGQWLYQLEQPTLRRRSGTYVNGVSALLALGGGRLLVLERELRIPRRKIGARVRTMLFEVSPKPGDSLLAKRLVCQFDTRMNLLHQSFANYEGMCLARTLSDGRQAILLVADSQGQYKHILRDWFRLIVLPPSR